ncbi:GNAT family N-acetyltransferase [Zhouia spongiae]|uniref:GNAT family N-acetyltransferase n=1 Tax=Zhouia spongiae TaxID=2202721 RepID=A0ABY3YRE5_9FLAO|nr:GNAT family N-acetyltransferase [Zhouia spongiae]UNZ00226.1 GNAT family N-acetyltransferase [Zhouia spongiae]
MKTNFETEEKKLDNPVWNSLNETHRNFSVVYQDAKFYKPEYGPFGGFIMPENSSDSIGKYADLIDNFYVVGKKPECKSKVTLNKNLVCDQMILKKPILFDVNEQIVELKSDIQKKELFDLVSLVQPGYFNSKTADLGKYYGIYKNDQLVSVTGERMKMNKFTEVSAVVTHPQHTGKGYARQLIKHATQHIFGENKTPYLHVAETNIGAIKLYEKLGFTNRRKISFWNLVLN